VRALVRSERFGRPFKQIWSKKIWSNLRRQILAGPGSQPAGQPHTQSISPATSSAHSGQSASQQSSQPASNPASQPAGHATSTIQPGQPAQPSPCNQRDREPTSPAKLAQPAVHQPTQPVWQPILLLSKNYTSVTLIRMFMTQAKDPK
jgi:hypothetical protein